MSRDCWHHFLAKVWPFGRRLAPPHEYQNHPRRNWTDKMPRAMKIRAQGLATWPSQRVTWHHLTISEVSLFHFVSTCFYHPASPANARCLQSALQRPAASGLWETHRRAPARCLPCDWPEMGAKSGLETGMVSKFGTQITKPSNLQDDQQFINEYYHCSREHRKHCHVYDGGRSHILRNLRHWKNMRCRTCRMHNSFTAPLPWPRQKSLRPWRGEWDKTGIDVSTWSFNNRSLISTYLNYLNLFWV